MNSAYNEIAIVSLRNASSEDIVMFLEETAKRLQALNIYPKGELLRKKFQTRAYGLVRELPQIAKEEWTVTIWRIKTSWEYEELGYDEEHYVRYIMAYRRGELSRWRPVYVGCSERHDCIPNFPGLSSDITCDEKAKSILDELIHGLC